MLGILPGKTIAAVLDSKLIGIRSKNIKYSNISQATKNSMLTIAMSCSSRFLSGFKPFGSAKI